MAHQILFNSAAIGDDRSVLECLGGDINVAVQRGTIPAEVTEYLDQIELVDLRPDLPWEHGYFKGLCSFNAGALLSKQQAKVRRFYRGADALLGHVGFPPGPGRLALRDCIATSVLDFSHAAKTSTACTLALFRPYDRQIWHADRRDRVRGNKTIYGDAGFLWRPNSAVPEEFKGQLDWHEDVVPDDRSIQRLKVGDLGAFLCGGSFNAASHATPPRPLSLKCRLVTLMGPTPSAFKR